MSEYIRTKKFDTNECPNIFVKEKLIRTNVRIYTRDQYIRIFEYSNIFVTLWFRYNGKSKLFLQTDVETIFVHILWACIIVAYFAGIISAAVGQRPWTTA